MNQTTQTISAMGPMGTVIAARAARTARTSRDPKLLELVTQQLAEQEGITRKPNTKGYAEIKMTETGSCVVNVHTYGRGDEKIEFLGGPKETDFAYTQARAFAKNLPGYELMDITAN